MNNNNKLLLEAALRVVFYLEDSELKKLLVGILSGTLTEEELLKVRQDFPYKGEKDTMDSFDTELRDSY